MSSSMVTDPTAQDNMHKPLVGNTNGTNHAPQREAIINVQPPRREDLQPSYAQILSGDDAYQHGWYGSMSMSLFNWLRQQWRPAFTNGS